MILTQECKTKTNLVSYVINHASAFKMKPKLFQQRARKFDSFQYLPCSRSCNKRGHVDTQSLEALDHSLNCHFQEYEQCRQQVQAYAEMVIFLLFQLTKCHQISSWNYYLQIQCVMLQRHNFVGL